jgi:hypothetical protein
MCKEDFIIFNVTNRGSNVFQTKTNEEYAVNIPSELRTKNSKSIKVEVIQGNICFTSSEDTKLLRELGVKCNLCTGFSTEVAGSFNTTNMNKLFTTDIEPYLCTSSIPNARKHSTSINSNSSFMISQLPEKLIFSRYHVNGAGNDNISKPFVALSYISFTLKLTYYMD